MNASSCIQGFFFLPRVIFWLRSTLSIFIVYTSSLLFSFCFLHIISLQLLSPLGLLLVNIWINRNLRLGYGIGKGFVVGEESILQQFDRIGNVVDKKIAKKLKKKVEVNRLDVIRSLGTTQVVLGIT